MILSDRRIGLKRISEALNISYERVHHIVHVNLDMKKIAAKCLNVELLLWMRLGYISTIQKQSNNRLPWSNHD